jgi:hypothetical protein
MNKSTSTSPTPNYDRIFRASTPASVLDKHLLLSTSRPISVLNSAVFQPREEIVRPVSITPTLFKKQKKTPKDLPLFIYDFLHQDYIPKIDARSKVGEYRRRNTIRRSDTLDMSRDSERSPGFFVTELNTSNNKPGQVWTLRKRNITQQERRAEYYDFAIGGNKHNIHIKTPLYKPQTIKVSPRSSIKLYTKQPISQLQDNTKRNRKRNIAPKSIENYKSGRTSLNQSIDSDAKRSKNEIHIHRGKERSTSCFAEKVAIIREITNFELDLEDDSDEDI